MTDTPFVKRVCRQDDDFEVIGSEDFTSTFELTRVKIGVSVSDLGIRIKRFQIMANEKSPLHP